MAALTKRVQVLVAEDEWQKLKRIAAEHDSSVGHLIREAIAQTYFRGEEKLQKDDRVRLAEEMISLKQG